MNAISRRTFLLSTALLSAVRPDLLFADAIPEFVPKSGAFDGQTLSFAASNDVGFGGFFGARYAKSLERLSKEPIDNVPFVLDDVNFNQKRRFFNYSGDISGRYIEVASLTSRPDKPTTAILPEVIDEIVQYQQPDGHFGREVDWDKPVDIAAATDQSLEMPILWGNGRLILGLFAAYERFGNEKALAAAKKMADFYVNIVVKRFCDPARMDEYSQQAAGYAAAYVTCVFHGIEGLVRAYRLTGEQKYLDCAREMADFHEQFDVLPVGHSHGSLSAHEALVLLYESTGEKKYLDRVVARWEEATSLGYVNPSGGVAENFRIDGKSDEGCSEADWLRLNLMLWRNTGDGKYLDFAERMLYNAYQANQWDTGGFGHRHLGVDEKGAFSWLARYAESYWCCSYHGPLGYYELKEFFAVGATDKNGKKTIFVNFPTLEFDVPLTFADGEKWTVSSRPSRDGNVWKTTIKATCENDASTAELKVRVPDWTGPVALSSTAQNGVENAFQFDVSPIIEDRRFNQIDVKAPAVGETVELKEVVLRLGPNVLVSKNDDGSKIEDLTLEIDENGKIAVPETLSSVYDMTDAERDGKHTFVFNVTLKRK